MASFNKVILLGNLTRDPELRYTPNGTPVSSFGLAVSRSYRQGDERKDEVCFVDITAFGRQAEIVGEYLSKGRPVLVEGHLRWSSWEGDGGQKRSKLDVVAENVRLMPRGRDDGTESRGRDRDNGMERTRGTETKRPQDDFDVPMPTEDDIPF